MQIKGGFARANSITFLSENFVATASRNRDETVTLNVRRRPFTNADNRLYNYIARLPLIRNIMSLLTVITQSKLVAVVMVMAVIVSFIPETSQNPVVDIVLSYINLFVYFMSLLVLVFIFYNFGAVKRHHGAEHKAANAFAQTGQLSFDSARRASRIHERCGTNHLTVIVVVAVVIQVATRWEFDYSLLAGMAIAGELTRLKNGKIKKPFLRVGEALQMHLLTAEPTDRELELAVRALSALQIKESPTNEQVA